MNKLIDSKLLSMFIDSVTETIFASDLPPGKQVDVLSKIESAYKTKVAAELESIKHLIPTHDKHPQN